MAIIPCSSSLSLSLPWDVILEILCRLPVASLLRFRSVSKSWCNLIDSEDFSKQHLNHPNAYMKLILLDEYGNGTSLFSIDLSTGEKRHLISLDSHFDDDEPIQRLTSVLELVVGSCNGLLCIRNKDRTLLFNPSTMRYQYMPWIPSISSAILGFGYDAVNDDYKLVMLLHVSSPISGHEVHVYSLKSSSCRVLEEVISYELPSLFNGMFVGGALHWVPIAGSQLYKIIAFDVETEEFREVPTPKIEHTNLSLCYVDVLEGNLCFISDYSIHLHFVDIWVMKEYGVESSWTKLISISDCCMERVQPLTYSKCRKHLLVLKGVHNTRWYDLENKDNSYVEYDHEIRYMKPYVLVDSLLHLNHIINTRGAPKRKRELPY